MNPDPNVLAYMSSLDARAERIERERRDALHRAAVARRRKRKHGGRK